MEQMKKCKRCEEDKPRSDFYAHSRMADGLLNFCKGCVRARVKKHRVENLDYVNWYDRQRANMPHRKKARMDYEKENPDVIRAAKLKWDSENRHKRLAHLRLGRAVAGGLLARLPCEICGLGESEAHHPDYTKPLEVIWLCPKHHAEMHVALRDQNRKNFNDTKSRKTKHLLQEKENTNG